MLEGTAGRASELKQQGALEASRDPDSSVDAAAAEDTLRQEAKAAGAAAFTFDPDATAEEKAAQVGGSAGDRPHRKHQVAALASDQDGGKADYDLTTSGKAGVVPLSEEPSADGSNGRLSKDDVDEYAKVGWAPRFGNPADMDEGGTLLDHQDFLEGKIDDKFFGDWYQNAGVIIFACLASWTVAILGGGLGWVFLVMATCGTYYRTSLRRVRRNFRDDITREMAKAKLETDTETLEWINSFMVKFWPIYAPVLCKTIVSSVDQVLSTSTPAFLDSMRMKFFTLGTKPPRLEHVKTYPKAGDDTVLMDWKFSFTPNDVADLTARQIKNKVNPKVVLEIRLGKAMISKGLDVIVEDMACSGIMRVKMKLQIPFPHIERVEICFLGRPTFDYVCKPIGGDFLGLDMNLIPGLESFIQEQIHANLAPMMYDPNVFPIEIAKMLAGNPVDQAIGVLQVTFHGAQGLKNPDKFSGTPDPYATVSINNRDVLGKTKTVRESASPRWNETVNVVLTSLKEPLTITVYDYNDYRKDKELGVCTFNLDQLEAEDMFENQRLEVMANGRARGIVSADIRYFPVLEGEKLADGTQQPPPESTTGIAKFTVEQAKDLDGTKSLVGALSPYAVLLLNGKEVQISQKLKRTNNPIWPDATKELLISDRKKAKLGLVIKDDKDLAADPVIGTYQIKLDDMLELEAQGQEWYNLAGAQTGRAKMMIQWKPVALKGALGGSGGYVEPIGVLRFHIQSAKDLKNVETIGKSDPYVRILLSGVNKGRTVTFQNNLNPDWDEVIYVPVHSVREKLTLEVMDEQDIGKDRTLGQLEVATGDYVRQSPSGEYLVHDSKTPLAEPLRLGRGSPKGTLNFTCAFYPTYNVVDPEDEDEEKREDSADIPRQSIEDRPVTRERANTAGTISSLKPGSIGSGTNGAEMRKALAEGEQEQTEANEVSHAEAPKIRIGAEDLGNYESGLVVFKLIEGDMGHTDCNLEIMVDENVFPAYTTSKIKTRKYIFNETGDVMVPELDLSRLTLRLVDKIDRKGEGEDHVQAKLEGNALETLKKCLYTPTQLTLKGSDGRTSTITVSLRYLPVKMQLDPSESFNNSGNLRVEVLDAADLPAADRNGFSDPYCEFELHGKEVHKTKVQKKTLHPAWNEFFEVPVRSRTAADFKVVIWDWDFGGKPDYLGSAVINLDVLEPFQAQEVTLGLDGESGAIRLKMLFKPDYVMRARQGSSTFSGTFSTPGKVIGAPVKGVGKGVTFLGGGALKGASFLGSRFKRRTASGKADVVQEPNGTLAEVRETSMDIPPVPGTPQSNRLVTDTSTVTKDKDLPATPHSRARSFNSHANNSPLTPHPSATGTASITVVSASGFDPDTKLEVRVLHDAPKGLKEVLKTKTIKTKTGEAQYEASEATEKVPCSADQGFRVVVRDNRTFGHDELGEAVFFVDDSGAGGERRVAVGDKGGSVVVRTGFEAAGEGFDGSSPRSGGGSLGKRLTVSRGGDGSGSGSAGGRQRSLTPGAG
ncbi:hypothetical protein MBLNU230_g7790t1 [Neophaeotheca triangularis]